MKPEICTLSQRDYRKTLIENSSCRYKRIFLIKVVLEEVFFIGTLSRGGYLKEGIPERVLPVDAILQKVIL